jgi:hypothetical protein
MSKYRSLEQVKSPISQTIFYRSSVDFFLNIILNIFIELGIPYTRVCIVPKYYFIINQKMKMYKRQSSRFED